MVEPFLDLEEDDHMFVRRGGRRCGIGVWRLVCGSGRKRSATLSRHAYSQTS